MKPISQYIAAMLATLLGVALTGCSSDHEPSSAESKMSISFRVETRNGGQTNAGESNADSSTDLYEDATAWENYIDITNGDYRIGFFDKNNLCITQFSPTTIDPVENSNYVDYVLTGQVPGVLTLYSDFKIVVLANWRSYPEMIAGVTKIDDLCCPNSGTLGQFDAFIGYGFEIKEGNRYVPMYGVKDYKDVKFGIDKDDNVTVLYDDLANTGIVNMLRAIAKVEVEFATDDDYTLDETKKIQITNYNAKGYCAPEGCYSEGDYYHNSWASDYWKGKLHLVRGTNDSGSKTLDMTKTDKDGKTVWVTYLPEYRNVVFGEGSYDCTHGSGEINITPAQIAVPLIRDGKEHTATIEFATYTNGEPGAPMNIERNNLYRFTITHVDQGIQWKVEALEWNCLLHDEIVM